MLKGARPIVDKEVADVYRVGKYSKIFSSELYFALWEEWLTSSNNKSILGLYEFTHRDYTQGTSQTFDNFILRHSNKRIITALPGDFKYHRCIGKFSNFKTLIGNRVQNCALIISLPFSDLGTTHPFFYSLLDTCNDYNIPVCLDLAYWGISQNINIDLRKYPCIQEVTCSLSKPFYTLENHRVGVRFSREYLDDGITMLNEVKMYNIHSMSLGIFYMENFSCDFIGDKYKELQIALCTQNNLTPTDTIIFGLGGEEYIDYNRGVPGINRVCISDLLALNYNETV